MKLQVLFAVVRQRSEATNLLCYIGVVVRVNRSSSILVVAVVGESVSHGAVRFNA